MTTDESALREAVRLHPREDAARGALIDYLIDYLKENGDWDLASVSAAVRADPTDKAAALMGCEWYARECGDDSRLSHALTYLGAGTPKDLVRNACVHSLGGIPAWRRVPCPVCHGKGASKYTPARGCEANCYEGDAGGLFLKRGYNWDPSSGDFRSERFRNVVVFEYGLLVRVRVTFDEVVDTAPTAGVSAWARTVARRHPFVGQFLATDRLPTRKLPNGKTSPLYGFLPDDELTVENDALGEGVPDFVHARLTRCDTREGALADLGRALVRIAREQL